VQQLDVAALFSEHHAAVSRYLRRQAPYLDTAVIEDLTADVFERALRAAPRYQERGYKPLTWLCEIARNRLIDYQRAWRPTDSVETLVEIRMEPRCTIRFDEFGERERMARALTHLPESQQRVLRARYWEDRKFVEMAEIGNENTVKHLDRRARASLRPYLEMSA
jgi:RNA polymerase sigma factor (sigma-70 family)